MESTKAAYRRAVERELARRVGERIAFHGRVSSEIRRAGRPVRMVPMWQDRGVSRMRQI